jgi:hypothetical protein
MFDVIALVLLLALGGLIVVVVGASVIYGLDVLHRYMEDRHDY